MFFSWFINTQLNYGSVINPHVIIQLISFTLYAYKYFKKDANLTHPISKNQSLLHTKKMSSKAFVFLGLLFAFVLLISSNVAASDLAHTSVKTENGESHMIRFYDTKNLDRNV